MLIEQMNLLARNVALVLELVEVWIRWMIVRVIGLFLPIRVV